MFWRKKKNENSDFFALHHRLIRGISMKDPFTYRETILGREGTVNITENELVVVCENVEVFRKPLAELRVAELMSHDGFTISDLSDENGMSYMVYYTK